MNIKTRSYDKYLDIQVEIENAKHDLGFHSKAEVVDFIESLKSAVEEMEDHLKYLETFYPDNAGDGSRQWR